MSAERRDTAASDDARILDTIGGAGSTRRVTISEVLRAHLAHLTQTGGERSSVKLTRNARGETQIEVVVRTGDSSEITTAAEDMAEATRLYDSLSLVYPVPEPGKPKVEREPS